MISTSALCDDIKNDKSTFTKYNPTRLLVINALYSDIYNVFNISSFNEISDNNSKQNIKNNIIAFEKEAGRITIIEVQSKKNIRFSWDSPGFISIYNVYIMKIRKLLGDTNKTKQVDGKSVNNFIYLIATYESLDYHNIIVNPGHNIISNSFVDSVKKNIELRKDEKIILKTTDTVECPNCKAHKATYYAKQIKSADEPMTIFYTCVECGHEWSTSN